MRILVVEDERLLCDGIAEDLELEKYTVDRCYGGADAYERLFVEPYDLVILDLNLPGMDGLELLRRIRNKSFQSEYQESRKALNYYWGMSAGVVELCCSDKLPDSTQKLAAILRDGICSGNCHPFRGPLYAQGGRQIIGASDTLSTEDIINMDWLVDNIVGSIPTYDELSEAAKATVGIVGVPSTKEKQTDT